jgi:hypothetical protein
MSTLQARQYNHDNCPFWARHVTLGLIRDRAILYAQNVGEKNEMIRGRQEGDVYFVAWTGKWTTDIFALTNDDLDKIVVARIESGR